LGVSKNWGKQGGLGSFWRLWGVKVRKGMGRCHHLSLKEEKINGEHLEDRRRSRKGEKVCSMSKFRWTAKDRFQQRESRESAIKLRNPLPGVSCRRSTIWGGKVKASSTARHLLPLGKSKGKGMSRCLIEPEILTKTGEVGRLVGCPKRS